MVLGTKGEIHDGFQKVNEYYCRRGFVGSVIMGDKVVQILSCLARIG